METYLGIDVGSVTTKFAVLDEKNELIASVYMTTDGKPMAAVQEGLKKIKEQLSVGVVVSGVGVTGGARYLVWFRREKWREDLYTPNELQSICRIKLLVRFADGAIYRCQPRSGSACTAARENRHWRG